MITTITPQVRTTDIAATVRFYTEVLGFVLEFQFEDFYAGIRIGKQMIHLKHVDEQDPSIPYVEHAGHLHLYLGTENVTDFAESLKAKGVKLVRDVHDTAWHTRELVINDDQGHTLYIGQTTN